MKDCCRHTKHTKKCKRRDKKIFNLPRRFTKKRCLEGINGYSMKSSCSPYKYCKNGGKLTFRKNILDKKLKKCSLDPLTGFYRDGYCMTGVEDLGSHTVCSEMDPLFLKFTKEKGNNLDKVVRPGERWCLCQDRWEEAYDNNVAPKVIFEATNKRTKPSISKKIKKTMKGGKKKKKKNKFPKLRKINTNNKKNIYRLKDPQHKRIIAIDDGIRSEKKKTKKTLKQVAVSKKGRLNILRIYRKNNFPNQCRKLTNDMKYIDRKYKLGKTSKICKKRGGGKKQFLYNPNNPKQSFDVYIDKDPTDTIPIKYTDINDVKNTIRKLEKLYKQGKYTHKRIWQVGMIMYVRLKVLKNKKPNEYKLSKKYFDFLKKRTKIKGEKGRKSFQFNFN